MSLVLKELNLLRRRHSLLISFHKKLAVPLEEAQLIHQLSPLFLMVQCFYSCMAQTGDLGNDF
ncbi:hypothetical protein JNUCC1_01511 [Lentibacillus sp. JNUCC-1]|nr:hypothetical protein [Lentibacillus sp. JNUCC-1]